MVGRRSACALVAVDLAAQAADRALDPDQQLGRELAEAADDARLERVELALAGKASTARSRAAADCGSRAAGT